MQKTFFTSALWSERDLNPRSRHNFLLYRSVSTRAVIGQFNGPNSGVRPAKFKVCFSRHAECPFKKTLKYIQRKSTRTKNKNKTKKQIKITDKVMTLVFSARICGPGASRLGHKFAWKKLGP